METERMKLKLFLQNNIHDVHAIEILMKEHQELESKFLPITQPRKLNGGDYADYVLHEIFNGGSVSFSEGRWHLWYYDPPSSEEVVEAIRTRQFVKNMFGGDPQDLDLFLAEPHAVEEPL